MVGIAMQCLERVKYKALASPADFSVWGFCISACCCSTGYGLAADYLAMMSTKI